MNILDPSLASAWADALLRASVQGGLAVATVVLSRIRRRLTRLSAHAAGGRSSFCAAEAAEHVNG